MARGIGSFSPPGFLLAMSQGPWTLAMDLRRTDVDIRFLIGQDPQKGVNCGGLSLDCPHCPGLDR